MQVFLKLMFSEIAAKYEKNNFMSKKYENLNLDFVYIIIDQTF